MMKDKVMELSQKFSRSVVKPVMFMAVMGTVLAIAVLLQLDFMPAIMKSFGALLSAMMNAMLNNLSVIFCVGLAATLAKKKKVDAAILGLIVFIVFLAANNQWLTMNNMLAEPGAAGLYGTGQNMVLGYQVVDMNVFLGLILGCLTGYVYNKFSEKEFIDVFRVYGGPRLAFIVMIPTVLVLAIVSCYVWPVVNGWISALSDLIKNSGLFGLFIYSFGNKFLIPLGLHHLLWMPFCFTPIGGTATIGGQAVSGAANIFYAEMSQAGSIMAMDSSIRFCTFGFVKVFGSLGVVLAMIKTAKQKNKAAVKGMLLPALFVSMIAGITEPIDFTFLFISPLLWAVHSVYAAISEVIIYALGARTYMLYGLLDDVISNSVFSPSVTKFYIVIIVGIIMTGVWYLTFVFLIQKLKIMTPGRSDDFGSDEEEKASQAASGSSAAVNMAQAKGGAISSPENAETMIRGLGGEENIISVTNCFTRLRCQVRDETKIDNDVLKKANQKGIVVKGKTVQIIIGMQVEDLKEVICSRLNFE